MQFVERYLTRRDKFCDETYRPIEFRRRSGLASGESRLKIVLRCSSSVIRIRRRGGVVSGSVVVGDTRSDRSQKGTGGNEPTGLRSVLTYMCCNRPTEQPLREGTDRYKYTTAVASQSIRRVYAPPSLIRRETLGRHSCK